MVDFYLQAIYTLTGILSYISLSTASGTLKSSNSDAEEDVCRYFVPMSDTICGLQSADNSLARSEALYQAIHGKYSPDKSSDDEFTEISQKRLFLGDFLQKQTLLDKVQRIVDAAQSTVQNERLGSQWLLSYRG